MIIYFPRNTVIRSFQYGYIPMAPFFIFHSMDFYKHIFFHLECFLWYKEKRSMEYHSQKQDRIYMSKGTVFTQALDYLSLLHRILVIQF